MKKTSIILPVYNVEDYVEQSIQSILKQTHPHFELIIVNDGSTDTSGEICEEYAREDGRIHLIHQENQGLSMARNNGLEVATGDYILFVDSDDYIHRDLLSVLYGHLRKHDAAVSVCDYLAVAEDEKESNYETSVYDTTYQVLDSLEAVSEIVEKSQARMIIACGKLYEKELFNQVRYPQGKYHEDEFVTYRLFYQAQKIVVTDAQLYFYRQRSESITGNRYSLKRLDKLEGLKEAISFFEEQGEKELAIHARVRYLLAIQISYYKLTYEMADQKRVLDALTEEYRKHYKLLQATGAKLSVFQAITLRAFYVLPKFYSFIVDLCLKIGWKPE